MLSSQIWHCLELGLLDGAEVLAEQLVAHDPESADAAFLLGTVHLRQNTPLVAESTVMRFQKTHAGCCYVAAQALVAQNRHFDAAKLIAATYSMWSQAPAVRGVTPAALWLLLGKCYRRADSTEPNEQAALALAASAKLDPYLWENVALLAATRGVELRVDNLFARFDDPFSGTDEDLFGPASVSVAGSVTGGGGVGGGRESLPLTSTPRATPRQQLRNALSTPRGVETPGAGSTQVSLETPVNMGPPLAPMRPRTRPQRERVLSTSFPGRRSLSGPANLTTSTASEYSFNQPTGPETPGVFEVLVHVHKAMARGHFQQTQELLKLLPAAHRQSPLALALAGRCLLETARYNEAAECYRELLSKQPGRIRDMEVFSTVLWHLRRNQELVTLARNKVLEYRDHPEAWCAMGNAFSLQEDPAKAIECFGRAIQLDPECAYAHALRGHELQANEQFQDALQSFRAALNADPYHMTAWFGMGSVYLSLGDEGNAEIHFERALRLNPENPILVTFLGSVYESRGQLSQALTQYSQACAMAPHAPFARFKRAEALLEAGMCREALAELRTLEGMVPDEASVKFALGRALKALGIREGATRAFTEALELDQKASHIIKEELNSLDVEVV